MLKMLHTLIEFIKFPLDDFPRTEIPLVYVSFFGVLSFGSTVNFCIFRLESFNLSIEAFQCINNAPGVYYYFNTPPTAYCT